MPERGVSDGALLLAALRAPQMADALTARDWTRLIGAARAERMLGVLAHRFDEAGLTAKLPRTVRANLAEAQTVIAQETRRALWEAEMFARAVAGVLPGPVVLLKGTAYAMAGLAAAKGRTPGDLDVLVPFAALDAVEAAAMAAGWEATKTDPYDLHYYRAWMHELPPLTHPLRNSELDIHHTILPRTARHTPDAVRLLADAAAIDARFARLNDADLVLHSIAHLFYDGEFDGALRNLWDIHMLLGAFGTQPGFWDNLLARAALHQLERPLADALETAWRLCGTDVPAAVMDGCAAHGRAWPMRGLMRSLIDARLADASFAAGSPAGALARAGLTVRAHWKKMPPGLLARHAWTKWRMRRAGEAGTSEPGPVAQ